jgi:hypothetical protein
MTRAGDNVVEARPLAATRLGGPPPACGGRSDAVGARPLAAARLGGPPPARGGEWRL